MEDPTTDIEAAWTQHSLARERTTFATANLLICLLVPVWSLFDLLLEPRLAGQFALLRLADVALTLLLWRRIARSDDLRHNRLCMVASLLALGLVIFAMLLQVGTTHYLLYIFGFSLVFWGAGLLLVWPPAYGVATFAGLLLPLALSYATTRRIPASELTGSLFYLVSAAAIASAQLVARRRLEQSVFFASYTLQARNVELASTVTALHTTQARLRASSTGLTESLDLATTAEHVLAILVPSFASWATLTVAGPDVGAVRVARHVDPDVGAALREALAGAEEPAQGRGREVLRIEDATRADVTRVAGAAVSEVAAARSLLVVPLVAHGGRLGTLVLGRTDRGYGDYEVVFAEEMAYRAGLALDNARLYATQQNAKEQADAANRAKDQFLAAVSHELRTPLSAILGWAKLLALDDLAEDKRAKARETIERNAVVMAQLIEDLIDVSRIVSGKLRIELASVDPARIVAAAVEALQPTADAKGIDVTWEHDATKGSVGTVRGDAARLQQVVWNLLSNAIKFTPAGGRVGVLVRRQDRHVEIVVRDSGKGIDPRFLPHVFEPFRQGDTLVTRPTSGLGLGLAIVKHIVELHGGITEAYSEGAGRGATFSVRLPVPDARTARGAAASPAPARKVEPRSELAGLRVLVVEDEPDMRQLVEEVLTACGSHVVAASSVDEAMAQFERGEIPDVLLSDIGMAGESGYDLIRRVRERPASKGGRVPAAALTAYTRAQDRRKALGAGFELHLPKPIEPDELIATVAALARLADGRAVP